MNVPSPARVDAVVIGAGFSGLYALHRLADTRDLLQSRVVATLNSAVDHVSVEPSPPAHRRLIVGAWHDRMAMREPALALHERWRGQLYWHDGGHAGHLFSRRVQATSERFLAAVSQ